MGIRFLRGGLAFTLLFASAAQAQGTSFGRGLSELSRMFDTGSPQLATAVEDAGDRPGRQPAGRVAALRRSQLGVDPGPGRGGGFPVQRPERSAAELIEGFVPIWALKSLAGVPGIAHVRAVAKPAKYAGSVQSQAVSVEKADLWPSPWRRRFSGIKVGVLSNSYDSSGPSGFHPDATDDIASGDLPADGVTVLQDDLTNPNGDDEGRAMLAAGPRHRPGAKLGFATANFGQGGFSNNILGPAQPVRGGRDRRRRPLLRRALLFRRAAGPRRWTRWWTRVRPTSPPPGTTGWRPTRPPSHPGLDQGRPEADRRREGEHQPRRGDRRRPPIRELPRLQRGEGPPRITQRLDSFVDNVLSFQWTSPSTCGKVRTDYNIYLFDPRRSLPRPTGSELPGLLHPGFQPPRRMEPLELLFPDAEQFQIAIARVVPGPATRLKYIVLNGVGESTRQNAPPPPGTTRRARARASRRSSTTSSTSRGLQLARPGDHPLRRPGQPSAPSGRPERPTDQRHRRRGQHRPRLRLGRERVAQLFRTPVPRRLTWRRWEPWCARPRVARAA